MSAPELAPVADGRNRSLCFVQGSQAPCAQFHPLRLAVFIDSHLLDVRLESAIGRALGVGHVVSVLNLLASQCTHARHTIHSAGITGLERSDSNIDPFWMTFCSVTSDEESITKGPRGF